MREEGQSEKQASNLPGQTAVPSGRMLSAVVTSKEEGMTLQRFLQGTLGLGKREISHAKFLERGICVDSEQKKVSAVLKAGQLVEVFLEDGKQASLQLGASPKMPEILYEDKDLLVVNKPAGISVHPPGRGSFLGDTLANRLVFYLREQGEECAVRILGRLDKDTSGVVLAAKNQAAAARIERQRELGILKKTYLALVSGVPSPSRGEICAPIGPVPACRQKMQVCAEGKYAHTRYEVQKSFSLPSGRSFSIVRLVLTTGRTHQIRVHMASLGCPLLGDSLYGGADFGAAIFRTALHAECLSFEQPFSGEKLRILAALPKDIARLCETVIE